MKNIKTFEAFVAKSKKSEDELDKLEYDLKSKKPTVKKKDRVSLTASRLKDLKSKTSIAKNKRKNLD